MSVTIVTTVLSGFVPPARAGGDEILKKYSHQPANGLEKSDSPYLRQHGHDLVKWRRWTPETLALAKKTDKPIFLSVGYSACHWCHVMQAESFNNKDIAAILNRDYIPVLVDREQRPDLDETYMLATEAISGRGGWPNNVLITPDLKPFYGGVYFPPDAMKKLLTLVAADWKDSRMGIQIEADRIAAILSGFFTRRVEAKALTEDVVDAAAKRLVARFDAFKGGIGTAPKHFYATALDFLLYQAEMRADKGALAAVELTLNAIARGGVNDLLAGGFHRYAVDNGWRQPHFEKMLYDQALLVPVFLRAAALTGKAGYRETARRTLNYVLADMTSPKGGFWSTRDADSEGEEGTFYLWTPEQLKQVLGDEDGTFAAKHFGVVSEGDLVGKVVLNRDTEPANDKERARIRAIVAKLADVRSRRVHPFRDEKILTGWNGLMISAMAQGARRLKSDAYGNAARKAADFVWQNMRQSDGRFWRSHFAGKASVDAVLVDYVYFANGLIDLYDLDGDTKWLTRAQTVMKTADKLFKDETVGDYFLTATKQGYARVKLRADSALPSGNAMALRVWTRLSRRLLSPEMRQRAEAVLAALSGAVANDPLGGATTLQAGALLLRGQVSDFAYAARGRVRLTARYDAKRGQLSVDLVLAPTWHINSNKPLEDQFIASEMVVRLDGKKLAATNITYPKAVKRKLGFNEKPLALYEGKFAFSAKTKPPASGVIEAEVTVQACNDEICLVPEKVKLRVVAKSD